MKRTITVLQDDIDNGCRMASQNCAIARAAQRDLADLMQEYAEISVTPACITVWRGISRVIVIYQAATPSGAVRFINAFDAGLPVEPFKFEIELTGPFGE